ncbi:dihydrolipoamide acetyltransferase family protein [Labilibaculum euxinus]|uniref:Dihydrolipoamide acetyltransferase component of pyruvate dehydrogenase complex n=1 Tax=Labilibaculum euxinus TaxID=2686357 RepID=A0A7M4D0R2_9BACT|nr:dihydrolipoamide acetyltransferase family protein [Labilibaculum euxinus]MUP36241.1 2-oxo acid dehydrogenase subunit E2 [Labilibaculum euxinus]MVB05446.1 2-oxo acid dehydrogenase subunit E2 [Labilibaculum euxinus]
MAKIEILIPAMGEGITEATITQFLKKIGDFVEEEDSIMEIATDKVDSEIPAPKAGKIVKFLFNEGDTPQVGDVVAIIATEGEEADTENTEESPVQKEQEPISEDFAAPVLLETIAPQISSKTEGGTFISPLVRTIARTENITTDELNQITGTGEAGRITKRDILQYLEDKKSQPTKIIPAEPIVAPIGSGSVAVTAHKSYEGENVEIIEMDRMRKLIAQYMLSSKQTSPHVTSFIDVDVTGLVNWRNKVKDEFLKKENQKLTFTPIFVEAVTGALKDYPMVNVSVDGDRIIRKKYINIGMATALPSGNLIVPVIKATDELNLIGITTKVNDLAERARNNKLQPDEIKGSTFTITNLGAFGSTTGTPIINQPEVAILAVGAIKKKPAVIETPHGDTIGIRQIMVLSLSYDHRVVDGALGGMFLKRIAENLENFDTKRTV